jgi:hypothetical protein
LKVPDWMQSVCFWTSWAQYSGKGRIGSQTGSNHAPLHIRWKRLVKIIYFLSFSFFTCKVGITIFKWQNSDADQMRRLKWKYLLWCLLYRNKSKEKVIWGTSCQTNTSMAGHIMIKRTAFLENMYSINVCGIHSC